MRIMLAAAMAWAAMAICAVLNGILRQAVLIPALGPGVARPLSAAILSLVVLGLAWGMQRWTGPLRPWTALTVGAAWVVGTVIFETVIGRMQGMSGREIAAAYDPLAPTLWFWVVVLIGLAPLLVGRLLR